MAETICKVILSTRTEHLSIRGADFSQTLAKKRDAQDRGVRVIELRPWTDQTALDHVEANAALAPEPGRSRLGELARQMRGGQASQHYGTLLTHPIFLDLIIDDVAEEAVRDANRTSLVRSWIMRKIRRDQRKYDGAPLGGDVTEETRLIFLALEDIAIEMTDSASLTPRERLPYGKVIDLLSSRGLRPDEVFEFLLKSILVSVGQRTSSTDADVMFSHRVFHEYLIASALAGRAMPVPPDAPSEIAKFHDELADLSRRDGPASSSLGG